MSVQTVNGAAVVDRRSPVPLYFQLARLLAGEIESLGWPAGHRLSSEADICQRYGVSRATVRQALQRLENEGLIERFKGAGTFVADTRGRSWLLQSPAGFFHDEVGRAGVEVTSKILRAQVTGLPRWAAAALGLDDGAEGVVLERLRYADGRVALHVTDYLPAVHAAAALGVAVRPPGARRNQRIWRKANARGHARRSSDRKAAGGRTPSSPAVYRVGLVGRTDASVPLLSALAED